MALAAAGQAVIEATLQRGPGPWVQRGGMRSTTQPYAAGLGVDVVVGEVLQFLGGGAVQQGCQPDERLVRVHAGVGLHRARSPPTAATAKPRSTTNSPSSAWKNVVIPRRGKPTQARRAEEHRKTFRRTVKWRTSSEGRISYLKRGFGWYRTRIDGTEGARILDRTRCPRPQPGQDQRPRRVTGDPRRITGQHNRQRHQHQIQHRYFSKWQEGTGPLPLSLSQNRTGQSPVTR